MALTWSAVSFGETCGASGVYKIYLSQDDDPTFLVDIPADTTSASFDLGSGILNTYSMVDQPLFQAYGIGKFVLSMEHISQTSARFTHSKCADQHDLILQCKSNLQMVPSISSLK